MQLIRYKRRYLQVFPAILATILLLPLPSLAYDKSFNPIPTAVPIIAVTPDARGAGMGDMGVATSADVNSQFWNAAKYPFSEAQMGLGLSVTPWLQDLVDDVNITYGSFYYRFDDMQSISASLRYFSLGSMEIRDEYGNKLDNVNPYELTVDLAYARRFGKYLSGALTLRYIRSDLTGGAYLDFGGGGFSQIEPANGFGADIGVYYQREHLNNEYAFGLAISNMGTKMSYTENSDKAFLPTTFRLGGRYTFNIDADNSIMGGLELSKLLVPTPAIRDDGSRSPNSSIDKGKNEYVSAVQGMFQSFYDGPYGFGEEVSEIMMSLGLEYAYRKLFFARAGYFYDSPRKGNRSYLTFGVGIKWSFLGLDLSYLHPFTVQDPLSNTFRISLAFDLNLRRVRR